MHAYVWGLAGACMHFWYAAGCLQPSHIVEERRALVAQLNTLKKAAAVLQRDPQIAGGQKPLLVLVLRYGALHL